MTPIHFADKVVIVRAATGVDSYGDPYVDWSRPTRTTVRGEVQWQNTATAPGIAGTLVIKRDLVALLPPGAIDGNPTYHRIEWQGKTYILDGAVMERRLRGRVHHIAVNLK